MKMDDYAKAAIEALQARYLPVRSWRAVAAGLPGFKAGNLNHVARGKRAASNALLHALGLPLRAVEVPPCPTCGEAHTVAWCTKAEGEPVKARAVRVRRDVPPMWEWTARQMREAIQGREVRLPRLTVGQALDVGDWLKRY